MKKLIKVPKQEIPDFGDTNILKANYKRHLQKRLNMALNTIKRKTLMEKE